MATGYGQSMNTEDLASRYGLPQAHAPRPVTAGKPALGHRAVIGNLHAELDLMLWERGFIAASDPYEGEGGRLFVNVVDVQTWWAWTLSEDPGKPPRCPLAKAWPAYLVYLE